MIITYINDTNEISVNSKESLISIKAIVQVNDVQC